MTDDNETGWQLFCGCCGAILNLIRFLVLIAISVFAILIILHGITATPPNWIQGIFGILLLAYQDYRMECLVKYTDKKRLEKKMNESGEFKCQKP